MSILDGVTGEMYETECRIIRDFEWVADDTPLPVNPDDYQQLVVARAWANEAKRYPEYSYDDFDDDEEDEGDNSFFENDMLALADFYDAVCRRIRAIEKWERMKLDAWNAGKPIPTSGVIV